ncbi:macoilin-1 isoform X1 [Lepeophtheirus salmonis]|uniref:macoilin-1 isoform X1 n=1 Tax=Lepeophtheirus salmonis TaxID=72036 RepID=UPI001AE2523F|nr:macoilin-1-like isoform X2 [Lepeophtheirus salmonis]
MKRRSAADGKLARRPLKRTKIAENFYGNSLVYIKLLLLWGLVLFADYFLEFRFEYLWPFWLFLRSVSDSFKYQGMAFSVFFICIALTSDMICFLFIPLHWLFFAASTYVWVQYVWHTEKGICFPTVFLWLLFVYIEVSIRLKEFKAHVDFKHYPFHLDLCRPFAAHCIGYPVVTLSFGIKSYVGYRIRVRRQKEVHKENEYYYEFCREALPPGSVRQDAFNPHPSPKPCSDDKISDQQGGNSVISVSNSWSSYGVVSWNGHNSDKQKSSPSAGSTSNSVESSMAKTASLNEGYSSNSLISSLSNGLLSASAGLGGCTNGPDLSNGKLITKNSKLNGSATNVDESEDVPPNNGNSSGGGGKGRSSKSGNASQSRDSSSKKSRDLSKLSKDELITRTESDIKRLKCDLQISRNKENELRDQIISYMSNERNLKSEISNLQVEKSVLDNKISSLLSTRACEKATVSNLEKRLADERKQKTDFQIKLETERKAKKDADKSERNAQQNRSDVAKLEIEIGKIRSELYSSQDRCSKAEQEIYVLRKYKESHGDPEQLVSTLNALRDKNSSLESSLSSVTKLKMDLFSALGEARRDLSLRQNIIIQKEKEIRELKQKISEVLAVMPPTSVCPTGAPNPRSSVITNSFGHNPSLSLDLPVSTDLSFNTGSSSLGLSNLDDKLNAQMESSSLYSPPPLSGSVYSPQTNGTILQFFADIISTSTFTQSWVNTND